MKKKTLIGGGAAVVVLAALLAWAFAPRPVEVEAASVDQGRFETTIDEDGRTTLHDRYVVAAPVAGQLARIRWRAGDRVEAGTVLALLAPLSAPMIDARTRAQLAARVSSAEAQSRRADDLADAAAVALEQASSDARRSVDLAAQGFVAPMRLDADRLAVQAAQKALDAARQARQAALHDLTQARAALATVERDRDTDPAREFAVRAPISGQVLRVLQTSEMAVAVGTPLLELGDTASLEVVAEVLTTDALQVAPGSAVRIEQWGGPGTLEGRVRAVEPAAFTKVSALGVEEQRVLVRIDLTSAPALWSGLGDGYRVGVRIITRRVDDALRVPVSAVFPRPDNEGHAVFRIDADRVHRVPVKVGARNGRHAWVQDGLRAGDSVVVYPPAALADGSRVRVRQP